MEPLCKLGLSRAGNQTLPNFFSITANKILQKISLERAFNSASNGVRFA